MSIPWHFSVAHQIRTLPSCCTIQITSFLNPFHYSAPCCRGLQPRAFLFRCCVGFTIYATRCSHTIVGSVYSILSTEKLIQLRHGSYIKGRFGVALPVSSTRSRLSGRRRLAPFPSVSLSQRSLRANLPPKAEKKFVACAFQQPNCSIQAHLVSRVLMGGQPQSLQPVVMRPIPN